MRKNQKNESLFESTHNFHSKSNAKEAKAEIITIRAILNYDLANCFKKYLQRLNRISPVSYNAQKEPLREQMYTLYKNAQTLAESK